MPSPLHRPSRVLLFGTFLLLLAPFVTIGASGSGITYPEQQKIDSSRPKISERYDRTDQSPLRNIVERSRRQIPESIPFAGFVKNLGQGGSPDISFYHTSSRLSVAFSVSKVTFAVRDEGTYKTMELFFEGGDACQPIGKKKSTHESNYFIGDERFTNVPAYQEIWYPDLYENIDLRYFMTEKGLKYEFIVRPGGDPSDIHLSVGDEASIHVDRSTVTIFSETGGKSILEDTGLVSFLKNGEEVPSQFRRIDRGTYGFDVSAYDRTRTLIIDPWNIPISTYLGGSSLDRIVDIAYGEGGQYVYLIGTGASGFPVKNGYDEDPAQTDAVVCKINTTGGLVYSTFVGGNYGEWGRGIAVDDITDVYITGETASTNFPTTDDAYQSSRASAGDAFVAKLNSTGNGLLYGSYLGGSENDEAFDISIAWSGETVGYYSPYIVGYTVSNDFPVTAGAYQTSYQGGSNDAFVARFNSTGGLNFSTYLGGDGHELNSPSFSGFGIEVIETGHAYVTGCTESNDFPTTVGAYDRDLDGWQEDVFVTKLNPTGDSLNWSTYVGGGDTDVAHDIALEYDFDSDDYFVYVGGQTYSDDFPVTGGSYDTGYSYRDGFLVKLSGDGTSLLAGTYIGGSEDDRIYGIDVTDEIGGKGVFATGWTMSNDFPTVSAFDDSFAGPLDAFVVNLTTDLTSLTFSTYLGGSGLDEGRDVLGWWNGNITVVGITESSDFPTTHALQESYGGNEDGFLTCFGIDTESPTITLSGITNESVQPSAGDIPLSVEDNFGLIDTVLASWNGGANATLTYPYTATVPTGDSNHILNVYTNDTGGNDASALFVFAPDNPPTISLYEIANETVVPSGWEIQLSVDDDFDMVHTVLASWDGADNTTLTDPYTAIQPTGEESHTLRVYVNDTGGKEDSALYVFTTDDPPAIVLTTPANNSVVQDGTLLDVDVTDDDTDTVFYSWGVSNHTWSEPYQTTINGVVGNKHLHVYANDTWGYWRHKHYIFELDNDAPTISLTAPANGTLQAPGVLVNLSLTENNPEDVFYHWDDASSNETATWFPSIPMIAGDGWHTLHVYAKDQASNSAYANFTFLVDGTDPAVEAVEDISFYEGTSGHEIAWSASDVHPYSYTIYKNGSLYDTGDWTDSDEVVTVDLDQLSLGTFNYTVVFADEVGNTGKDTVMVTVLMESTTTTTTTTTGTTTETSTTTTTTASTTTTPPPVELDDSLLLVVGASAAAIVVVIIVVMLRKNKMGN
ncbi:MAG: hypothetical protein GF309_15595 [Candidatus Lokiarchaeota archaeon]|nr:hypothetical protein [Candidatus Lokiarchaeota archaeon]